MRPVATLGIACFAAIGFAAVIGIAGPDGVRAADITVTTAEDSLEVDGACSLREAVIAANTNLPVDSCAAGDAPDANADQIHLDPGSTYRLTIEGRDEDGGLTGDLDITEGLNILGGPIDAGGVDRAFDIHPGAGVGLLVGPLTGGDAGAGDGGAVRMRYDCASGGSRRLLTGGLISGNVATNGGAIAAIGCVGVDIEHATLIGNSATDDGGAVWLDLGARLNATSATFTGNTAGGRGSAVWATSDSNGFQLVAATIAENVAGEGGAIGSDAEPPGRVDLIDVLLAQNAGGNCALSAVIDGQHNLSDDDSCGDLGLNSISNVDPMLEALDSSWVLPTYGLAAGSPAIDAGLAVHLETNEFYDQRGTLRPQDGDGDGVPVWDIGSVEAPGPDPEPTPSPGIPNTSLPPGTPSRIWPVALIAIFVIGGPLVASGVRWRVARRSTR